MSWDTFMEHLLGPSGGLFALGLMIGAGASLRWAAPYLFMPQIRALQLRVSELEAEIAPYRKFKEEAAQAAMKPTRLSGD